MNYIKKLQDQNRDLNNQLIEAQKMAFALLDYASSRKFCGDLEDELIHNKDVIHRTQLILNEINPIETEFKSIAERLIQV